MKTIITLIITLLSFGAFASTDECENRAPAAKKRSCYQQSILKQEQMTVAYMKTLRQEMTGKNYRILVLENESFKRDMNNGCQAKQDCLLASHKSLNEHLAFLIRGYRSNKK